tara:strand:+ start:1108 stop:1281 length:174 start_codon:yes stop_codon:yes gene_type:complete
MTLADMTSALHVHLGSGFFGNYDSQFDVTDEQAERIASKATGAIDFIVIWSFQDWWL